MIIKTSEEDMVIVSPPEELAQTINDIPQQWSSLTTIERQGSLQSLSGSQDEIHARIFSVNSLRTCQCSPNHLNCLTAKEWLKNQIGVWQFVYNGRDVRDKKLHPATFPIALAKRVIELFTHRGELVLDPFLGSGTTLVAAQEVS